MATKNQENKLSKMQIEDQMERAQPIEEFFHQDVAFEQIEEPIVDYVLRCVKGPLSYINRFIYINLTEEGEVIGSGDSEDVTLRIKNAGLADRHCSIKYEKNLNTETYGYNLKDLDSKHLGTWIKPCVDSYVFICNNLRLRINNQEYYVKFNEEKIDHLQHWLSRVNMPNLYERLVTEGFDSLEKISQSKNLIYDFLDNDQDREKFEAALDDLQQNFSKDYVEKEIEIIKSSSQKHLTGKIGWRGVLVTSQVQQDVAKIEDYDVIVVEQPDGQPLEFAINFNYGHYWLRATINNKAEIYYQLEAQSPHLLRPGEHLCIGCLEFSVARFNSGIFHNKGTRKTMEDAVICIQDLGISKYLSSSLFAVFDGHGGTECAEFLEQKFAQILKQIIINEGSLDQQINMYQYLYSVLWDAVLQTDLDFYEQYTYTGRCLDTGAAGNIVLILGNILVNTNVGDCRAVLSRNGRAIVLSRDHKPSDEHEKKRIYEAGGTVEMDRVCGRLAISRAFGDFQYKKEERNPTTDFISVTPEIRSVLLDFQTDEFLIIGCDGLFDVYSSQDCVNFVRGKLLEKELAEQDPHAVAQELCDQVVKASVEQKKVSDNVSVIIVTFSRGIPRQGHSSIMQMNASGSIQRNKPF